MLPRFARTALYTRVQRTQLKWRKMLRVQRTGSLPLLAAKHLYRDWRWNQYREQANANANKSARKDDRFELVVPAVMVAGAYNTNVTWLSVFCVGAFKK